ncbi:FAD-dependent oxidoreductase [Bacteroides sp. 51]|uniref:FAD-dependent oxidoreductase n=1 Tax=Bacteroides sp. 51 TaxID=2302938 RepID=UPI0013D6ED7D|nr:FAD-dependent oxidoreductase [Bacteroides sp. 51]NDV80698.1 FAD-dependent oxidoreductase [Bacteroides sp. 51]
MKRVIIILYVILSCFTSYAGERYDVVIVGGTPGGIMTAISAAREGKKILLLERTAYIGGLPANGLGATDLATRGATTGLFQEFLDRNLKHYTDKYGAGSQQVKDCNGGFYFEPSVAYNTLQTMLNERNDLITVLTMRQFDSDPRHVQLENDRITSIQILNRNNQETETYRGKVFVDATYEGDLAAAAGVRFRVGREGKSEFDEPGAGKVYKYWGGKEQDCSTFIGDNAIQAYNYRLCLTDDPSNMIPIQKPSNYNREDYQSLIEDIWTGRHTGVQMEQVTPEILEENRKHIAKGNPTKLPGDRWGIHKITNMKRMPNAKTDANNQHLSFVSTDLPEENWPWPTSGWEWRDKYAERLKEYTLGLLWFVQNDKELPAHFRKATRKWGLAKDEYADNANFPRQVYVREGRRFEGEHFFTAHDALPVSRGQRPPVYATSITSSDYALDSHAVRKREPGKINLEGFISYGAAPYTVPYGVIVPKGVDNLLIPVPASGSHIGFSTLRMEPCWMALGQAAGLAASIGIDKNMKMKNVDVSLIQEKLIAQHATLIYFRDLPANDPDYALAQYMGIRGYLPEWNAQLDGTVDKKTATLWSALSRTKVEEGGIRRTKLQEIYEKIK